MVQIPKATSTSQLTQQTTAPRINDPASFTQVSKAVGTAAQALLSVDQEFKRLNTLREVSRGTVDANNKLTALESQLLNSPELSETSFAEFNEQAKSIIDETLSTISDERARLQLGITLEGTQLTKGFNVRRNGRNRDIENAEVETAAVEEQAAFDIYKDDGSHKDIIRGNLITHYNQQIAIGFKTKQQIAERLEKFDETVRTGKANFDFEALTTAKGGREITERIIGAEQMRSRLINDFYTELTTAEEETLLTKIDNFIERETKRAKQQKEVQQRQNEKEDLPSIIDGTLQESDIRLAELEGRYSGTFSANALAYQKSKLAPPAVTDMNEYVRIRKMQSGLIRNINTNKGIDRQFTEEEVIAEVLRIGNESLTEEHMKQLVEKSFDAIAKRSDAHQKNQVKNLEARFKVQLLGTDSDVVEPPAVIQQLINQHLFKFYQRADALDNPTNEQLSDIATDVYNEWAASPVDEGGLGFDGEPEQVPDVIYGVGGAVKRLHQDGTSKAKTKAKIVF